MQISTVGVDLAKNVFQVHAVDAHGKTILKKQLKREQMAPFFANLPPSLIGTEACGSAHHWARKLQLMGHGSPGRAFIEWACSNAEGLGKRLRTAVQALTREWVSDGASGQVERVGARFALVGVAGELATEVGLTGWPAGESARGARACFDAWLSARGGAGNG